MNKKAFIEWLRREGAEVLAPTNAYEVARFIAHGGTHVIYEGRRGISANGFAWTCFNAFNEKRHVDMGITKKQRNGTLKTKCALRERDGEMCFFCFEKMPESDMSIEHLVSIQNGGPNHMDNLVLAHKKCNRQADNHPLKYKIEIVKVGFLKWIL